MQLKRYKVIMIVESFLLAVSLGLGIWWYVHNKVVREVEKVLEDGSSYEGSWLAGKMHGEGIHMSPEGEIYEGSFVEGRRDGHGRAKYKDGSEYEGLWKDDLRHGTGSYRSPKGNVYEGEWRYGRLDDGILKSADWTYTGQMQGMSPSGVGVVDYKDGRVYAGYWHKGFKQGLGRMCHPDGKVEFGFWDQGSLMHSGKKDFRTGSKVYGVDVSRYQGSWNWENLALYADKKGEVYYSDAKFGYELQPPFFILMKATEGSDWVDPKYVENVAQAKEGRFIKGAYHFFSVYADVRSQIENFKKNAVVEKGDFPPILDIEPSHATMHDVGVDSVRNMALEWLQAIEDHYGVRPVIYTNDRFRKEFLNTSDFAKYDFWMARYSKKGPQSGKWLLWQFTQTGRPRGINAETDINVFDGNLSDFRAYLKKAWNN
jgi:lysozyme